LSFSEDCSVRRTPARMAMIGGGGGAFIGPVHRRAAALDGVVTIVAGAFSSDRSRNAETGRSLGLDPQRVYSSYDALFEREAARPADERPDFVCIVTPNHLHAPVAMAALSHGFPVFCEKPLTRDLPDARELCALADATGLPVGVAYTYLGYPLVHEARRLVQAGTIGTVRRVDVRYTQGWLSQPIERSGNAQAAWRMDARTAGIAGAVGDIGVHAQSLVEFVSGEQITEVSADLRQTVRGRELDDDCSMLLRLTNGVRGTLAASQICAGDDNRLEVSVYGESGGIHWAQERPDRLILNVAGQPKRHITCDAALVGEPARSMLRLPAGHPEGYLEAFANLYLEFVGRISGGKSWAGLSHHDGLRSMAFIKAVIQSGAGNGRWRTIQA